jgi:hypothetical protein
LKEKWSSIVVEANDDDDNLQLGTQNDFTWLLLAVQIDDAIGFEGNSSGRVAGWEL